METLELIYAYYTLLDRGVLTWSVIKLSFLVTLTHYVCRLTPATWSGGRVFLWALLLIPLFFTARHSLQSDLKQGVSTLAKKYLSQKPVNHPLIRQMILQGNHDPTLLQAYLDFLMKTRGVNDALSFFHQIPDSALQTDYLQHTLTRALIQAEKLPEAIQAARRVIDLAENDENLIWGYHALADVYLQLGQPEKAIQTIQEEMRAIPGEECQKLLEKKIRDIRMSMTTPSEPQ